MATKKKALLDLAPQPDPLAPLDSPRLLTALQAMQTELEADLLLRARASTAVREALRLRHEAERRARRTADPLDLWERHFVTQVAASWILSCVFVRTLEDRGLLGMHRLAGPGAADSQTIFFELAPSLSEREYLLTVFGELTHFQAARDLFDARHNPVWLLGPSVDMTKKLLMPSYSSRRVLAMACTSSFASEARHFQLVSTMGRSPPVEYVAVARSQALSNSGVRVRDPHRAPRS